MYILSTQSRIVSNSNKSSFNTLFTDDGRANRELLKHIFIWQLITIYVNCNVHKQIKRRVYIFENVGYIAEGPKVKVKT